LRRHHFEMGTMSNNMRTTHQTEFSPKVSLVINLTFKTSTRDHSGVKDSKH
jgi:hypothetical protein